MILLGPEVWVNVLGNESAIFPYNNPALFSIPIAFLVTFIVSSLDKSKSAEEEKAKFISQYVRSHIGGEGISAAVQQYRQVNHPDFFEEKNS